MVQNSGGPSLPVGKSLEADSNICPRWIIIINRTRLIVCPFNYKKGTSLRCVLVVLMKLGIDVGSTTVKLIILNNDNEIIYSRYERHMSNVFDKVGELLVDLKKSQGDLEFHAVITGSGGMSLAKILNIPFEQEVIACTKAIETIIPETDVAIELGGEDAKITFFGSTVEQRMNGTCAGGTGAFIDQMAVLLHTDAAGLNEAAKNHTMIYPIASRCGVFAKTDIQPLINDGAKTADIAASIFQAVVNQMISGLACGHKIKGNVAFLGGPLEYLSELRKRFIETLVLSDEEVLFPNNAKYFVAIGAALLAKNTSNKVKLSSLIDTVKNANPAMAGGTVYLKPLFNNETELAEFRKRHDRAKVKRGNLKTAYGPLFLGIDAGSTTTKAVLINSDKEILFEHYQSNEGDPINVVKNILKTMYDLLPKQTYIGRSVVTGYGEGLIKAAYRLDAGEIETMAHYKAAEEFLEGVSFILDIGGQDMKCMRIKDGAINNIMLNEACSAGCGSFIETFAKSVNKTVPEFAKEALLSRKPVDLGTRCTVFMNSKVKQAQKEGATVADISAGLSYSVIKNALYKVIKLRNPDETGDKIVVQGGTFLNEAVLRSIELILGKEVVRPDASGLMGAYGAAIIAADEYKKGAISTILGKDEIDDFSVVTANGRCGKCGNNCLLTISNFNDGSKYITGNRCEKGASESVTPNKNPDLYKEKLKLLFNRPKLKPKEAARGVIGIPRVLNMYEDYPFWHSFFKTLGFSIVLSPVSSKKIYELGMDSISSDTACYPAKMVHGHIKWLVNNGVKRIFYPCINFEVIEDKEAANHYNCPIVATYPEVIDKNMAELFGESGVEYYHPFLPFDNDNRLVEELYRFFNGRRKIDTDRVKHTAKIYGYNDDKREFSLFKMHISRQELRAAIRAGRKSYQSFKEDMDKKGTEAIKFMEEHGKKGIILSGRPYHLDSEINHGINNIVNQQDMVVLTEDSVANKVKLARDVRVLDQWMYHSRLYRAAIFAGQRDDIELVQLNSFGCGLDAVTTDQVDELLSQNNKLYTVLKIDEGSNLGAAKIRIRSLKAALIARQKAGTPALGINKPYKRVLFTKEMKDDFTLLVPQMSPIHFQYFAPILRAAGYKAELLPKSTKNSEEEGLRYINNDACYPTIVTLGQIISALKSGKYDLNKVGVFMSQTGGGCRASNYVALLRKALKDLGMSQIPVISFNVAGLEQNSGFKISPKMALSLVFAVNYGDLIMKCLYQTRPYEQIRGSANEIMKSYYDKIVRNVLNCKVGEFKRNIKEIISAYDELPLYDIKKPRVGIVGEILVKYHPNANNNLVELIESEGGEAVVPSFIDFFEYGMLNKTFNYKHLAGSRKDMFYNNAALRAVEHYREFVREALRKSARFEPDEYIQNTAVNAEEFLSMGNQCGEGWLLTGEMVDLIDSGVKNILCLQPFACLPNHVTGKGMIKTMRKYDKDANIVAIDYDPGASNVNQLNRIKMMMSTAFKNLEKN